MNYDYTQHANHDKRHRKISPHCHCVGCQDCKVIFSAKCPEHFDGVDESADETYKEVNKTAKELYIEGSICNPTVLTTEEEIEMTEEKLTKISVICNKEIAAKLMKQLNEMEKKEYLHWYEDCPTENDLGDYEGLKGSVPFTFYTEVVKEFPVPDTLKEEEDSDFRNE